MRHSLQLEFKTPFSIGIGNAALFHTYTHKVIPGATLRGALAARWWKRFENAEAFNRLFDEDLVVRQAIPEGAELLPATTRACKYQTFPECSEVLLDEAVFAAAGEELTQDLCWHCDSPLVLRTGWQGLPDHARRGRVRLRSDETAEDGQLFSRDYIGVGARVYQAELLTTDDLGWLHGATIHIGQGRSHDRGKAMVTIRDADVENVAWPAARRPIAVHLLSPAIITDNWGAPSLRIEDLEREIQLASEEEISVWRQPGWLRTELVTGWHTRSRLPKQPDWALAAGSTFIVEGLSSQGWNRLTSGIGWRTLEGYGQLALSPLEPSIRPPAPIDQATWRELSAPLRRLANWGSNKPILIQTMEGFSTGKAADSEAISRAAERFPLGFGREAEIHRGNVMKILGLSQSDLALLVDKLKSKEWK